ncbi:MAG: ABC transporter permease [Oscillospiraceae bacterium]|nr:ABC transporter permease [Oscillospiraceae bacterium]
MADLLYGCFVSLCRKGKRTLLTSISIAIGVCSVILISSLGSTGIEMINEEVKHLGLNGIVVSSDSKVSDFRLTDKEVEAILKIEEINGAAGMSINTGLVRMHGLISNAVVWGVGPDYQQVMSIPLKYGRYFGSDDISDSEMVCLLDIQSAKEFYKRGNIVGKQLSLEYANKRYNFEIVGIVEAGGQGIQGALGDYLPTFLYIPATTMQNITGKAGYSQISVDTAQNASVDMTKILELTEKTSGIYGIFTIDNLSEQNKRLTDMLNGVSLTLSLIAGISLVVAAVGTMTIMMSSVKERTKEIGIKKSIGASNKRIMSEFLLESIMISCLGTLFGVIVSVSLILLAGKSFQGISVVINGIGLAAIICIGLGAIFGMIPAYQAAKLNPIDSLRSDS